MGIALPFLLASRQFHSRILGASAKIQRSGDWPLRRAVPYNASIGKVFSCKYLNFVVANGKLYPALFSIVDVKRNTLKVHI